MGKMINVQEILVQKFEGKRPPGIFRIWGGE